MGLNVPRVSLTTSKKAPAASALSKGIKRKPTDAESAPAKSPAKKAKTTQPTSAAPKDGKKKTLERARVEKQAAQEDIAAEAGVKAKGKGKAVKPASADDVVKNKPTPKAKAKLTTLAVPQTVSRPTAKSAPTPKKSSKKAKPAPPSDHEEEDADEAESNAEEGAESDESADVHLHGFSTDEDDSSDEEEEVPAVDVGKLPTVAKDDAAVKRKLERAKREKTEERGVLYLGRIPHGFYEDEMRAYFSQFGDVTRLRLSRNKKSGHSKHYGFIEFASAPVAKIVAETMDNYLLMGHILRCKVIPPEEVHPELWVGANRRWRRVPIDRVVRVRHNKPRTEEQREKAEDRLLRRQEEKKRKLVEAGIDYNFDAVAYTKKPKTKEA